MDLDTVLRYFIEILIRLFSSYIFPSIVLQAGIQPLLSVERPVFLKQQLTLPAGHAPSFGTFYHLEVNPLEHIVNLSLKGGE